MNEYRNEITMFFKNLRLAEAKEIIEKWINEKKVSSEKGNAYKEFLNKYQMMIEKHLWNEEELFELAKNENIINYAPDVKQEIDRLSKLIKMIKADDRGLILLYITAYYAVANQNSSLMKICLNEIWEKMTGEQDFMAKDNPLGGYQKFQFIGTELEKYYKLENPISEIVDNFKVDLCVL